MCATPYVVIARGQKGLDSVTANILQCLIEYQTYDKAGYIFGSRHFGPREVLLLEQSFCLQSRGIVGK